jgi:O-antigen/teichoic acid export membrane protein
VGLVYGLVFAAALFVCAPLVTVLLGDDYDGTVTMLRVLSPLVAVRACAEFPLNGLLGLGKLGVRTATIAGAAVSALALYLLLIPALGWQGAVIGTYASEVLLGIVAWLCLLHYQRKHDAALRERSDLAA